MGGLQLTHLMASLMLLLLMLVTRGMFPMYLVLVFLTQLFIMANCGLVTLGVLALGCGIAIPVAAGVC